MELQGQLPILFILMGIVILLTLMAAVGVWVRGGGMKLEDVENLMNDSHQRSRDEIAALKSELEQTRKTQETGLSLHHENLAGKITHMETAIHGAAKGQGDALTERMESVKSLISDSERRTQEKVGTLYSNLDNLNRQVSKVGQEMTKALTEMTRQQKEQKAQSTIQLCEALITSLGTLKTSISDQIDHSGDPFAVESEAVSTDSSSALLDLDSHDHVETDATIQPDTPHLESGSHSDSSEASEPVSEDNETDPEEVIVIDESEQEPSPSSYDNSNDHLPHDYSHSTDTPEEQDSYGFPFEKHDEDPESPERVSP